MTLFVCTMKHYNNSKKQLITFSIRCDTPGKSFAQLLLFFIFVLTD